MPTGQVLLDRARQDPIWKKLPVSQSVKGGNEPRAKAFQVSLMRQAQEIAELYTIFNSVRTKETGDTPKWVRTVGTKVLFVYNASALSFCSSLPTM